MLGLYQPPESSWLFDNQTLKADGNTLVPPKPVLGGTNTLTPAASSVSWRQGTYRG